MMVKKFLTAVLALTVILYGATSAYAAKKTVAVIPLESFGDDVSRRAAQIMSEQLISVIQNSGVFAVVERTQAGAILREQGFQNIASESPVEMGKMTGADYSVLGSVTLASVAEDESKGMDFIGLLINAGVQEDDDSKMGKAAVFLKDMLNSRYIGKVALDIRFADNKTGEIIFAKTFEGENSGKDADIVLHDACKDAAEKIFNEMKNENPFSARVEDFFGDNIYIDCGTIDGLRVGEPLLISREGEPIVVRGKIVGMKNFEVGRVQVVEVNSDYSVCKILVGHGLIRKGDIVKRG